MKILNLTLKKKWFDMILSGEKLEEYREVKPYWIQRLTWHEYHKCDYLILLHSVANGKAIRKDFDYIRFKNGYGKDAPAMSVELKGIHYGYPAKPEWCDDNSGTWFFCIELGKIYKVDNVAGWQALKINLVIPE